MDTLAKAYRWSYDEIMRLTYLQIVMLNHAADVNQRRMDAHIRERRNLTASEEVAEEVTIGGKKLTDLTSDEYMQYLGANSDLRPKVIKVPKPPA